MVSQDKNILGLGEVCIIMLMILTDPNIAPWEMLGYTIEPSWWSTVYGPILH